MPKRPPIENILFDIGVVLLSIDYGPALAEIVPLCDPAKHLSAETVFTLVGRDPIIQKYERGEVDTEAFFKRFVSLTGYSGTIDNFIRVWMLILTENKPMLEFAQRLARSYDTYLVTNAGRVHIPTVYQRFPALNFRKGEAASCDIGAIKPDSEFYERALRKFGIAPETCLLIDDRPENVKGAQDFGIRAVTYTSPEACMADVQMLLKCGCS